MVDISVPVTSTKSDSTSLANSSSKGGEIIKEASKDESIFSGGRKMPSAKAVLKTFDEASPKVKKTFDGGADYYDENDKHVGRNSIISDGKHTGNKIEYYKPDGSIIRFYDINGDGKPEMITLTKNGKNSVWKDTDQDGYADK